MFEPKVSWVSFTVKEFGSICAITTTKECLCNFNKNWELKELMLFKVRMQIRNKSIKRIYLNQNKVAQVLITKCNLWAMNMDRLVIEDILNEKSKLI